MKYYYFVYTIHICSNSFYKEYSDQFIDSYKQEPLTVHLVYKIEIKDRESQKWVSYFIGNVNLAVCP